MIWALLALLGIPIWFIVATLLVIFRNRRYVKQDPNAFAFKTSTDKGWSKGVAYGRWVSDVLFVRTGFPLLRVTASQVSKVEADSELDPVPRGLGESATRLAISHSDGKAQEVAVDTNQLRLAMGPDLSRTSDGQQQGVQSGG